MVRSGVRWVCGRGVALAALASMLLAAAGCREQAPMERAPSVFVDSAGIRIVTSDPFSSAAYCALGEEPVFSVGTVEGDEPYMFGRIQDVARLSDGTVAVVDGSSREVRVFDEAGVHLRSIGGRGEGPGEFRNPWLFWVLPGDTLWVSRDYLPWQFNVYSSDGAYLRMVEPAPFGVHSFVRGGVLDNGASVNVSQVAPATDDSRIPFRWITMAHGRDGILIDTIARLPGVRLFPSTESSNYNVIPLFEASALVAARGTTVAMTDAREPEVRVMDESFRMHRFVRWLEPGREVTAAHTRAFREDYMAERGGRTSEDWSVGDEVLVTEERPVAERFPTASDLMVGRDGRLWVERFTRPREQKSWMAFDHGGDFLCHLTNPADLTIHEFGSDHVLGVQRDQLDVERVMMYELRLP